MKKNLRYIVCFIVFIVCCLSASAQSLCQKGTWIVGLNPANYSFANYNTWTEYSDGKKTNGDTTKFTGVGFAFYTGAGYFIKDNFCIGAGFGSNLFPGGVPSSFVLPTQLFARYYLMRKMHCFSFTRQENMRRYAFFIEGAINGGYAIYNSQDKAINKKETDYSYGGKIAVGYTYVFTKHLAFEMMGMYNYTSWSTIAITSQQLPVKRIDIHYTQGFNLLCGVQAYF